MKRRIFTYLGALFLMSYIICNNVSAASRTYYLRYGTYTYGFPRFSGSQGGSTVNVLTGQPYNIHNNVYVIPGDRILTSAAFYFNSSKSAIDISSFTDWSLSFSYCGDGVSFIPSSNDYFRLTDYYESKVLDRQFMENIQNSNNFIISDVASCHNVFLKGKLPNSNSISSFDLGTTGQGQFTRLFNYNNIDDSISLYNLVIVSPIVVFYDNPNEAEVALEKEKQETQAAADESEQVAEDNGSNEASTTLSNNLNNIFSTISSTRASNCIIAGNLGNINMGNLNLCQGKENFNQLFEFIGYTSLFTVCFWAAYHLISRTIKLIDWARS